MSLVLGTGALLVLFGGMAVLLAICCGIAIRFLQAVGDRLTQGIGCAWFLWLALLAGVVLAVLLI